MSGNHQDSTTEDNDVALINDGGRWVVDADGEEELLLAQQQHNEGEAHSKSGHDDETPHDTVATRPNTPQGMHSTAIGETPLLGATTVDGIETTPQSKKVAIAPVPSPVPSAVSSPRKNPQDTASVVVVSAAGSVPPKGGRQRVPMPPPPVVYETHTTLGNRSDRSLRGNKLCTKTVCTNSPRNFPRGRTSGINGPAQVKHPYDPVSSCKAARLANIKRRGRACNAELVVQSSEPAVTMFTIQRPELSEGHIDQLDWASFSNGGIRSHPSTTNHMLPPSPPHPPRSTAEQIAVLGQESTVTGTVLRMRHLPVPPTAMTQAHQIVELMCPRAQFPSQPKRFFVAVPDRRHLAGRGVRQAPDHRARYHTLLEGGITMDDVEAASPAYVMAVEAYDKPFMIRQLRGKSGTGGLQASMNLPLVPFKTREKSSSPGGSGGGEKTDGLLEVIGASSHSHLTHSPRSSASTPTLEVLVGVDDGRPPISGRLRVDEERKLLTSPHYTSSLARRHSLDNLIRKSHRTRNAYLGIKDPEVPACPSFLSPLTTKPPSTISSVSARPGAFYNSINNNVVVVDTTASAGGGVVVAKAPIERLRERMALEDDSDISQDPSPNSNSSVPPLSKRKESARRRYEEHQGLLLAAAVPDIM